MLARVSTFDGGTADGIRAALDQLKAEIPNGPPPGIKSSGLTVLVDPDNGRALWIGFFANEDDLRESEAALQQMNPPDGMGTRSSVEIYEVGAEVRM
jgi:hypothetical protein